MLVLVDLGVLVVVSSTSVASTVASTMASTVAAAVAATVPSVWFEAWTGGVGLGFVVSVVVSRRIAEGPFPASSLRFVSKVGHFLVKVV